MRQIKPETVIRRRVKALQEALKVADEEKQTVVSPLIGQVARLEYQLQKLMEQLEEVGFVEEYKNGENQFGTKESTVSKAYSTTFKNYVSAIRTLVQCLPATAAPDAEDTLTEFIKNRP